VRAYHGAVFIGDENAATRISVQTLLALLWIIWCGAATGASPVLVEVLAGGIGEQEQQGLAAREKDFNLKLIFSLTQGNYLDVDIVVSDAKGAEITRQDATGPWVLIRLPAGNYTVTAAQRGKVFTRSLKVDLRRLRTEYFRWPADPNEDLPVSRWLDPD
jgi:hypothetical protein